MPPAAGSRRAARSDPTKRSSVGPYHQAAAKHAAAQIAYVYRYQLKIRIAPRGS